MIKIIENSDFPGSAEVKTLCFHCRGAGLIPGQGTKVSHAAWCSQEKKKNFFSIENKYKLFLNSRKIS